MSGFTKVDNHIFEALPLLSGSEVKILLVIIRKTKGWNKECDWISHSQFIKHTGLSRRSITSALTGLLQKKIIQIVNATGKKVSLSERRRASKLYYKLCKNCTGHYQTNAKKSMKAMQKLHTTKDKQQKDSVQKLTDRERVLQILSA